MEFFLPFASVSRVPAATGLSPGAGRIPVSALVLVQRLGADWNILVELSVALGSLGRAQVCPEQGCAQGCIPRVGSVTPRGPPPLQATAVPARWEPAGAPDGQVLLGEGSLRGQRGGDSPGHGRGSGHGPPSPPALHRLRHLWPRPNLLVADVASLTPTHMKAAQPLSGPRPFPSWVIWHSWSSFPTRQQHQLQHLISSGCNPGWNQVRGSCWCQWRSV